MDTIKEEPTISPKQKRFLKTLEENLGVVTQSCEEAKMPRSTFYLWKKESPVFAAAVEEIENVALDFVEHSMFERIKEKSDYLIKFYLATKGKKRGYVERQEINHDGTIGVYPLSKDEWEEKAAKRLNEANKQLEKFNE